MLHRNLKLATATPATGNLLEFLGWVAARPRTYADAMEAWRTSCPRLSAWEDATNDGLVRVERRDAARHAESFVRLTERGAAFLTDVRVSQIPHAASNCT